MASVGDEETMAKDNTAKRRQWLPNNPFGRKTLRQTLLDMTLHGVDHTTETDRRMWSRIIWGLAFFASLAYFLYMYSQLMADYYTYRYKTVVESTPSKTLPFPAITVCNINTLDVSNVSYGQTLRDIVLQTAFRQTDVFSTQNITQEQWQIYNMSAQQILEDTDPGLNNTIVYCSYNDVILNCEEILEATHWSMTRCYTLRTDKLHLASAVTSLQLVINIMQQGYVVQTDKSAGVKFFVHAVNDAPSLDAETYTASPGFSTNVGITYSQLTMLGSPFKAYGNRYCIKTADIDRSGLPDRDRPYSLRECLKQRALELAHRNCSCITPFETNSTLPVCTLFQMLTCVDPTLAVTRENIYNASDILGCPLPCEYNNYLPSITFSYYPSHQSELVLKSRGYITDSDIRSNYLQLSFYYTELILHKTSHVPDYTSMSIMGSIGGNMGFFLGASILSVGEVVELLIIVAITLVRRLVKLCSTRQHDSRE